MVLSVAITVPLATWAALRKGRLAGQVVRVVIVSLGMPGYWIGMMLLQFFAVRSRVELGGRVGAGAATGGLTDDEERIDSLSDGFRRMRRMSGDVARYHIKRLTTR